MKKLLFAALILSSGLVSANSEMMIEESYTQLGDLSALITKPRHSGSELPFSSSSAFSGSPSSEDGVCKTLGYEKAAEGSSRSDRQIADTIRVDAAGSVIGGPRAYRMTQIVCLNKIDGSNHKPSKLIKDFELLHPDSRLPFSASSAFSGSPSSEDGVCKALGYEKAAEGSSRTDKRVFDTIRVDGNGNVIEGPRAYRMTQIVCLNKIDGSNHKPSKLIKDFELLHPDSRLPFSASSAFSGSPSSEDGVCKALGYEKAAAGSSRTDKRVFDTIRVDGNGNVIEGLRAYRMTQIVCL